jgi:PBSX family phage terminase large subunit
MMVGNTTETLELNCIEPLKDLIPVAIKHNSGWRQFFIFDKRVSIRGANDIGQEKKFRGPTLVDAYGDEVTTWAKTVFKMLRTRLDKAGSAAFLTTNPDQPLHYLNVDYIERVKEISLRLWHFVLDDNPGLTDEYKSDLIRENPPGTVYYLRFILGLWVVAEGRVFKFLTKEPKDGYVISELPTDLTSWLVAADYGQMHNTVYVLAGFSPSMNRWIAVKEFFTNGKTNAVYSEEFKREILGYNGGIVPLEINIDPGGGGSSLIAQFNADYPTLSTSAAKKKDVAKEIQDLSTAMFQHKICLYDKGCARGITEMMGYCWNEKAGQAGREEPLKANDDFCDAFRYLYQLCMRYS